MPTARTGLRGMTWVNTLHAYSLCLGFVGHEGVQLSKRPTVEPPFGRALFVLAPTQSGSGSDVPEVFQDKGCA
jgi:hypothetical protein